MDSIRLWALSVCFACVAAGMLQRIAAAHGRLSVIKLVLTLYILITALAPLHTLSSEVSFTLPAAPAVEDAVDPRALALDQARQTLAAQFGEVLRGQGLDAAVDVELAVTQDRAEIVRVVVTGTGLDRARVEALALETFETEVPVELREG